MPRKRATKKKPAKKAAAPRVSPMAHLARKVQGIDTRLGNIETKVSSIRGTKKKKKRKHHGGNGLYGSAIEHGVVYED